MIDPAPDFLADQEQWIDACLFSTYENRWAEHMRVIIVTNAAYTSVYYEYVNYNDFLSHEWFILSYPTNHSVRLSFLYMLSSSYDLLKSH
jgi:hypothetical protein